MAQEGIRAIGLGYVAFAGRCMRKDARKQECKDDDALGQVRKAVIGHRKLELALAQASCQE